VVWQHGVLVVVVVVVPMLVLVLVPPVVALVLEVVAAVAVVLLLVGEFVVVEDCAGPTQEAAECFGPGEQERLAIPCFLPQYFQSGGSAGEMHHSRLGSTLPCGHLHMCELLLGPRVFLLLPILHNLGCHP
jgi:hypothetical protein